MRSTAAWKRSPPACTCSSRLRRGRRPTSSPRGSGSHVLGWPPMELTPQAVRTTGFKTVRKGYDPTEVDGFKDRVASAIESAQNQATAMEARARAAVAKLQELTQSPPKEESATPAAGAAAPVEAPAAAKPAPLASDDAETISRTL